MYLEGDALDLFPWIHSERTLLYWEELVKALQENYGPVEFQNPDEHLCNVKQKGSVPSGICQASCMYSELVGPLFTESILEQPERRIESRC